MKIFFSLLPFLISITTGTLFLKILFKDKHELSPDLRIVLGAGLGLGLNAFITFFSFIFLGELSAFMVVLISGLFLILALKLSDARFISIRSGLRPKIKLNSFVPYLTLLLLSIPLWIHAKFYPLGGWDAWSVWNFKAKFLFLSGPHWKNMFSPTLWRSSPHYPLLLPLINVWGWSFNSSPISFVPFLTGILFTWSCALLLYASLKDLTQTKLALLPSMVLLCLPLYLMFASSQYCDIVVSFYLLASLFCLIKTKKENDKNFALLSGVFLGLLSFTKPEGFLSAFILLFCAIPYFVWKENFKEKKNLLIALFGAAFIAMIPSFIFKFALAPSNQTFINGITSKANPSTWLRLQIIFKYLGIELISGKWFGIWIILLTGLILSKGRCFQRKILILPLYFILYFSVLILYYFINTKFEILWWLSVTTSRILFTLLPIFFFWVFASLWME